MYWVRVLSFLSFDWKFIFGFCSYLNNWDKKIPNLDVADDYRSEREEIHKAQGKDFPFSFGDVSARCSINKNSLNDMSSMWSKY